MTTEDVYMLRLFTVFIYLLLPVIAGYRSTRYWLIELGWWYTAYQFAVGEYWVAHLVVWFVSQIIYFFLAQDE